MNCDVRKEYGGFHRMLREDAEDYLGWLVGKEPVEAPGEKGTAIVIAFPFVKAEDLWSDPTENPFDPSNEFSIARSLLDMGFNLPNSENLLLQFSPEYADDDFFWSCWSNRVSSTFELSRIEKIFSTLMNSLTVDIQLVVCENFSLCYGELIQLSDLAAIDQTLQRVNQAVTSQTAARA